MGVRDRVLHAGLVAACIVLTITSLSLLISREEIIRILRCCIVASHRPDLLLAKLQSVDILIEVIVGTYGLYYFAGAGRAKSIAIAALGITYMPIK